MIRQDLVISPDVIERIKNEFMDLNLRSIWDNMKYKRLVIDKGEEGIIVGEIKKILIGANKFIVEKVQKEILNSMFSAQRGKFIEIKNAKTFSHNKINNLLLNLTILTESKILNIEDVTVKKLIIPKFEELKEIELLNIQDSIKPPIDSKIFNAERNIDLYYNDEFRIHEVLEHYFKSTLSLIICDKYVIHKNSGYNILFDILNVCKNLKELEIWSEFEHNKKEDFVTIEELKNDLNKHIELNKLELKYTICQSLRTQHRRHIYTDFFDIKSDVGFNFLDKQYNVTKSDTDIIIKEKDSIITQSILKVQNIIRRKKQILYKNYN